MSTGQGSAGHRAAEAFTEVYGRAPSSVWSAPGRVNLIGEHTDYNEGLVLPFALPHRTAVAVSPRTDGVLSAVTVGNDGQVQHSPAVAVADLHPGAVRGWSAYPMGVAWALRTESFDLSGADLAVVGEVPTGAGLSSSHALQCAVALALLDAHGRSVDTPGAPSRDEIARWVQRSENDFVGAPTGLLDQTASLSCVESHALYYDVRTGDKIQIPFDTAAHDLEVLVIDTRANHSHSDSGYRQRREGCERAARELNLRALRDCGPEDLPDALPRLPEELRPLVRHIVTENARVSATVTELRESRIPAIGPLLNASHASLRDDFQVSCLELNIAVDSALEAGALGARMTGGGFGGSAIALVRSSTRDEVEHNVRKGFAEHSLPTPRLFSALPSAGAGRDL